MLPSARTDRETKKEEERWERAEETEADTHSAEHSRNYLMAFPFYRLCICLHVCVCVHLANNTVSPRCRPLIASNPGFLYLARNHYNFQIRYRLAKYTFLLYNSPKCLSYHLQRQSQKRDMLNIRVIFKDNPSRWKQAKHAKQLLLRILCEGRGGRLRLRADYRAFPSRAFIFQIDNVVGLGDQPGDFHMKRCFPSEINECYYLLSFFRSILRALFSLLWVK